MARAGRSVDAWIPGFASGPPALPRVLHPPLRTSPGELDSLAVPGRLGAEAPWIGADARASQVETIRVPGGPDRHVARGTAVRVTAQRLAEQRRLPIVELKELPPELLGEPGRSQPVLGVVTVALATGVVQEGEELDHFGIRSGPPGQPEPVGAHAGPVSGAVNSLPVQEELSAEAEEQAAAIHR